MALSEAPAVIVPSAGCSYAAPTDHKVFCHTICSYEEDILLKINQRKNRNFDIIESVDFIFDALKTQFTERKLYIRYAVDKTEVVISDFFDDKTIMIGTDPSYKPDKAFSIYGLSDKYLEVDLEVIEERGPGYFHCRIVSGRRAVQGRRDIRFKVNPDEVVATNFKISKHTIDLTDFKIPTSIKVVLDQFQTNNSKMSDIVNVDVFSHDDKNTILKNLKKTGNTLFISDTSDPESYRALTDDFINIGELLGNELMNYVKLNVQKGYKSIIIVPVIYITEDEKSIPFGYIRLISKTVNFDLEKVLEVKEHSFKLVDRIRDANTIFLPVHQKIMDISRGGAKLKISDDNLQKSILKSKGFIFDIVFKLQAPITIYGEIKATYDEDGDLYVGVDFEGNSSRKNEMKRFYSVIQPMEADYKSKLMKTMKNRKKQPLR